MRWRRPILALFLCSLSLAAAPSAPSGYIVWSSARSGVNCIYRMKSDGTEIVRLVEEESDYPRWSPDGRWISYVTPDATWLMRPDGSQKKKLPIQIDFPDWSADGRALIGSQIDDIVRMLVRYDIASGKSERLVDFDVFPQLKDARIAKAALAAPTLTLPRSAGGGGKALTRSAWGGAEVSARWLFVMTDRFDGGYAATNGRFRPGGAWAVAMLDLRNPAALYYVGEGCQPAVDPAGEYVYHSNQGGGIAQMRVGDTSRKSYRIFARPDKQAAWTYCPAISTDRRWLTYVASPRHESWGIGDYDVYLQSLDAPDAPRTRLAPHPANDRWPHLYVGPLPIDAPSAPVTQPTTRSADSITFIGEMLATSKLPSPFNIKPYRECLILTKYRVIEPIEGKIPDRAILVVHWGMKDLKPTPESAFKPGQRLRLTCEPFSSHKKLERYPLANDIPDSVNRDWWLATGVKDEG